MPTVEEPPTRRQRFISGLWYARIGVLVLFPAMVAGIGGFAGLKSGQTRVYFILAAIFTTLLASFLNGFQEIQKRRAVASAIEARAALASSVSSAGRPIVSLLGCVVSAGNDVDRRGETNALLRMTLQIAYSQCGRLAGKNCRTRSTFYQFVSAEHLTRRGWAGRDDRAPRQDFRSTGLDDEREANAKGVIGVANGENYLLITDVEKAAPHYFCEYKGRPYKSFIMVPVRTEKRNYGFLSVDSNLAHSLTEADAGYLVLLAGILASALALLPGEFPQLDGESPPVPHQASGGSSNSTTEANR